MWVTTVDEITGCSRKNCTKFTTILQLCTTEIRRFQQNVQKENVYTTKASVWIRQLNILCFSWQVNYLKTAQSTCWQITLANTLSFWLLKGVSTVKNLFIQEPRRPTTDLALSQPTFLQMLACIQPFQFVCYCQGLNDMVSKHFELQIILGILAILTTEECEIPVSLVISRGLLLVSGCPSWLQTKSSNSMVESVLTERRRPPVES